MREVASSVSWSVPAKGFLAAAGERQDVARYVSTGTSPHYHARISHHVLALAGGVGRGRIFHQLRVARAEALCGGQHRYRRTVAAHADALAAHGLEQTGGIAGEDAVNRLLVLRARDAVALVVVHVAGGDDQDRLLLPLYHARQRFAEFHERFEPANADADRHEGKVAHRGLQERELHFERMFGEVRVGVFGEGAQFALEFGGERGVNRRFAERREPCAFAHDGQRLADAGVVGRKNNVAPRQLEPRVEG